MPPCEFKKFGPYDFNAPTGHDLHQYEKTSVCRSMPDESKPLKSLSEALGLRSTSRSERRDAKKYRCLLGSVK
jgi:hypothetical protein